MTDITSHPNFQIANFQALCNELSLLATDGSLWANPLEWTHLNTRQVLGTAARHFGPYACTFEGIMIYQVRLKFWSYCHEPTHMFYSVSRFSLLVLCWNSQGSGYHRCLILGSLILYKDWRHKRAHQQDGKLEGMGHHTMSFEASDSKRIPLGSDRILPWCNKIFWLRFNAVFSSCWLLTAGATSYWIFVGSSILDWLHGYWCTLTISSWRPWYEREPSCSTWSGSTVLVEYSSRGEW